MQGRENFFYQTWALQKRCLTLEYSNFGSIRTTRDALNKWFLYNRIFNIGFFEIGLQTFELSYNDILCLFNLFSYLNTYICSQNNLLLFKHQIVRSTPLGKKFTVACRCSLPCRLLGWPWLAGWPCVRLAGHACWPADCACGWLTVHCLLCVLAGGPCQLAMVMVGLR